MNIVILLLACLIFCHTSMTIVQGQDYADFARGAGMKRRNNRFVILL